MASIRFANVLLETNERALNHPAMYYRTDRPMLAGSHGEWHIDGPAHVDLTTYFNALSVLKLRRYTRATGFLLHLDVRSNAPVTVTQTVADRLAQTPRTLDDVTETAKGDGKWHTLTLRLRTDDDTVLAGFAIDALAEASIRDGWYEVELDGEPDDVELAIATTTFRKEPYITRNIELIRTQLLESNADIAGHLTLHVIDNGGTLPADELSEGRISVTPNDNVGGAGGFARGMLAALAQPVPATHVLLMDDDIAVSPESILRTYNLLRIVNDDYRDAFVSGAMLKLEEPDTMHEDTGYISPSDGACMPAKPPIQVTHFEDLVYNETFDEALAVPADARRYAAWWYCCIPAATIREHGLPLPVFVRFDDVEYGARCRPKFMTMNAIGVWHARFETRYNAAVERYQNVRNPLVAQCTTGVTPSMAAVLRGIHDMFARDLRKFDYDAAELVLLGIEDFLKGPRFLEDPAARTRFMDAAARGERTVGFDELREQARALGITDFDPDKLTRQRVDLEVPTRLRQRAADTVARAAQEALRYERKLADESPDQSYAIVSRSGWQDPGEVVRGKSVLVAIDWPNRRGAIRVRDDARYLQLTGRWKRDLAYLRRHEDELTRQYRDAAPMLESPDFWKRYLDI
ncbi:MAG: glycosyltransferase [Bifidobacterium sp.]|nr:glycosyltransferase [Bifidobacterium sp.]